MHMCQGQEQQPADKVQELIRLAERLSGDAKLIFTSSSDIRIFSLLDERLNELRQSKDVNDLGALICDMYLYNFDYRCNDVENVRRFYYYLDIATKPELSVKDIKEEGILDFGCIFDTLMHYVTALAKRLPTPIRTPINNYLQTAFTKKTLDAIKELMLYLNCTIKQEIQAAIDMRNVGEISGVSSRLARHRYDLKLMSNLPQGDSEQAEVGKIYLNIMDGSYTVRDPQGVVQTASLKESGMNLDHLENRLTDEVLKRQILKVTSQAGHTPKLPTPGFDGLFINRGKKSEPDKDVNIELADFSVPNSRSL